MSRLVACLLIALGLAACSPNPDQKVDSPTTELSQIEDQPVAPPVQWVCEDGRTLTATVYAEPERVLLALPDGTTRALPQVVSASGVLYEGDTLRFHSKGDEAYFAEGEQVTNCKQKSAP